MKKKKENVQQEDTEKQKSVKLKDGQENQSRKFKKKVTMQSTMRGF